MIEYCVQSSKAHDSYERVPGWRFLSEEDEEALYASGRNRVTDTCIPEEEAFRRVGRHLLQVWQQAEADDEKLMPCVHPVENISSLLCSHFLRIHSR